MRILSIESSADETSISIVEVTGEFPTATYEIVGNGLRSQVELHNQYGGIFPMMAKREHAKAVVPLLEVALTEALLLRSEPTALNEAQITALKSILEREDELANTLIDWLSRHELPEIDLIAVTNGPGLEPALWIGVMFAKALALVLECPIIPVNHMEGHILASLYDVEVDNGLAPIKFPALALLVSGGHTELVVMRDWGQYEKVGQTRDDAVGEAFDKVARLLGMPYPGGPEIGRAANEARAANLPPYTGKPLPRPMLTSDDFDFSFSGLKTAVLYAVKDKTLSEIDKQAIARDFEDAAIDVLYKKTLRALEHFGAQTIVIGGGVSASQRLRQVFTEELLTTHPDIEVYLPHRHLSTDNSVMIALAGHAHHTTARTAGAIAMIRADGNRSL